MCGINGILLKNGGQREILYDFVNQMNDLIIHRGPDDHGSYVDDNEHISIGMGMRRLSIIDLDSGAQPMYSDNKQIIIVFNGEIYNYKELRKRLTDEGITFKTSSDTEVILKAYEKYSTESFKWLDGMFGFSIYDKYTNKLFIVRDFFGEKPLYYTEDAKKFVWGSELKSLISTLPSKPAISKKGLNLFFRLTYIPPPHTIYEGIHKLESNHFIEYDLKKINYEIRKISVEPKPVEQKISFEDAKEEVKNLVSNSVKSRSISDVPLGTFLSGGVDSSIVSLCLAQSTNKKINTFSVGFKKASYDETDKSQIVAKLIDSNHHEFIIDESDLKNDIHDIIINFDEPFSDSAALPTHLLSNRTKKSVTVALTGDGGDEVFGGYNKYYVGKMNKKYTSLVPKFIHKPVRSLSNRFLVSKDDNRGRKFQINKLLNAINYEGDFYWDIISLANTSKQLSEIFNTEYFEENLFEEYKAILDYKPVKDLTDFRMVDKSLSLDGGMLAKVDRTSMMESLECRAPFLNKKIWEFTNTLPESYLINGWNKKYILKEAFRDQFPENFLERSKSGFGVPVGDWLRQGLKSELENYIGEDFLDQQKIFNKNIIIKLVREHLDGKKDSTFRVWAFYCFQKWYYYTYLNNS